MCLIIKRTEASGERDAAEVAAGDLESAASFTRNCCIMHPVASSTMSKKVCS